VRKRAFDFRSELDAAASGRAAPFNYDGRENSREVTIMADWGRLEIGMRWVLDPRNNAKGYGSMKAALEANDVNRLGQVKNAFHDSITQGGERANFDDCARENQGRVYALGRSILGLQ
jgi:hypothetical protein